MSSESFSLAPTYVRAASVPDLLRIRCRSKLHFRSSLRNEFPPMWPLESSLLPFVCSTSFSNLSRRTSRPSSQQGGREPLTRATMSFLWLQRMQNSDVNHGAFISSKINCSGERYFYHCPKTRLLRKNDCNNQEKWCDERIRNLPKYSHNVSFTLCFVWINSLATSRESSLSSANDSPDKRKWTRSLSSLCYQAIEASQGSAKALSLCARKVS